MDLTKKSKVSEETRMKMRLAKLGKPLSEEHRKRLSEVRKGVWSGDKNPSKREDVRKKLSEIRKGSHRPTISTALKKGYAEGKIKHWSKGRTGVFSPETLKKLSEWQIGMHHYEETKNCEMCGESMIVYTSTQRFCDKCQQKNRTQQHNIYITLPENAPMQKIRMQSHKIPLYTKCGICGRTESLERHHWRYDKPDIFSTLCKECHSIQHIKNFARWQECKLIIGGYS